MLQMAEFVVASNKMSALTYFLVAFVLIWVIIATIVDLKKREVPDWISFSLIAIVLAARLLFSFIENNYSYILWGLAYLALFFIIAHLFYYARIFAGGDAKLLMGIGVALAPPLTIAAAGTWPLPFSFIANLLIAGSVYGLLFTAFYAYVNREKFSREFFSRKKKMPSWLFLLAGLVFVILSLATKFYVFIAFAILIALYPYFYIGIKSMERVCLICLVDPRKLTEGDWLAKSVKVKGKIIKPNWEGLSKKELSLLQKAKKKILVKYGLPFVPAFLLALIITLLFGNLVELFIAIMAVL